MTGSVLTNDGPASSPFPDLPSCSLKACDESGEVVSGHASRLSVARDGRKKVVVRPRQDLYLEKRSRVRRSGGRIRRDPRKMIRHHRCNIATMTRSPTPGPPTLSTHGLEPFDEEIFAIVHMLGFQRFVYVYSGGSLSVCAVTSVTRSRASHFLRCLLTLPTVAASTFSGS